MAVFLTSLRLRLPLMQAVHLPFGSTSVCVCVVCTQVEGSSHKPSGGGGSGQPRGYRNSILSEEKVAFVLGHK